MNNESQQNTSGNQGGALGNVEKEGEKLLSNQGGNQGGNQENQGNQGGNQENQGKQGGNQGNQGGGMGGGMVGNVEKEGEKLLDNKGNQGN